MSRNLRDWTEALRTDVTQARAENGEHSSLTERLSRRLTAMLEVSGELGAVAECPTNEAVTPSADLGAIVTRAIEAVASRANRRGVQLKADVASELTFAVREQTLGVLLRSLLTQGIEATPRGENVMVRLLARNDRLSISVEDGGPSVPIQARKDVLAHRVDPGAYGRPAGVSLVVADATAAYLGGSLLFRESTAGRTELAVELGSPSPTGGG